jgi:hypothetical protein
MPLRTCVMRGVWWGQHHRCWVLHAPPRASWQTQASPLLLLVLSQA